MGVEIFSKIYIIIIHHFIGIHWEQARDEEIFYFDKRKSARHHFFYMPEQSIRLLLHLK